MAEQVTKLEAQVELLRRKCMNNFGTFARYMMPELEKGILYGTKELIWGPHHDALCDHLQAFAEGAIGKLGVSIPPGTTKTSICTILWPLWLWLRDPTLSTIHCCHSLSLAHDINTEKRNAIKSERFQSLFSPSWHLTTDNVGVFRNSEGGESIATSVGAGITGEHADIIILDDPAKASETDLGKHVSYFHTELASRRVPGSEEKTLVVMQRIGIKDIIGDLLERKYFDIYLCIPCEYEPKIDPGENILGYKDWRTHEGETINEKMYPEDRRERLKKNQRIWATQYQQRPVALTGNILEPHWWRRFDPKNLSTEKGKWYGAWDLTFGAVGTDNDYAVGQVWYFEGADSYLMAQLRAKTGFVNQTKMMVDLAAQHPQVLKWFVEDKASGKQAMDVLRRKIRGLTPVKSSTSKLVRVESIAGYVASGNVYIPIGKTGDGFIEEATSFPIGNDDQVDCAAWAHIGIGKLHGYVQRTIGEKKYSGNMWTSGSEMEIDDERPRGTFGR